MLLGSIHFSFIIYSTLAVRVAVFQLQAHAIMRSGHSILSLASCCFGFNCILKFTFYKNILDIDSIKI
jgi:hypothetical protein